MSRTKQESLLKRIFNDNYHRRVTSPFAVQHSPRRFKHDGVDYGANIGEGLYPIANEFEVLRTVTNVSKNYGKTTYSDKDFGNYVLYYVPAYDVTLLYAHMQSVDVKKGKYNEYRRLGKAGITGLSLGPHLHLGFAKGKHSTLASIRKNASNFETWQPKKAGKRYLNIHEGKKYGTYSLGVQPVYKNIDKWLRPDKFGGMSYEIIGDTDYQDVYLIETKDFGKRQVYLDISRASITDKPLYKVRGKGDEKSKPKQKPKYKEVTNKVVNDVRLGKYGDEPIRSKKLKEAGYNPKEVQDAVNRSYGAKPKKPSIEKGSKVRVKSSTKKYATGQEIPNWVKQRTFTVQEKDKSKVLLKEINSWVNLSDVKKV